MSIKSAVLAFVLILVSSFAESDEHVIYSKSTLEKDIVDEIGRQGFSLKQSNNDQAVYSKPGFWNRKRFKIEKTQHYLKLALPEEFVDQFDQFVR